MKDLKIAAVCMKSLPREIDKNLDRIESFVQEASERDVNIICFPELSITGYILENPHNICSRIQSEEIVERVIRMAQNEGLIIIVGMIEITDDLKPHISQVVASPDGLLGKYRKTHLSPQEKESYGAGEKLDVFKNRDITFGVQLCYEAHFPEISTVMALKGADIIRMDVSAFIEGTVKFGTIINPVKKAFEFFKLKFSDLLPREGFQPRVPVCRFHHGHVSFPIDRTHFLWEEA